MSMTDYLETQIIIRDKNTLETITETDNVIDPLIYEEINSRYDFKFSTVPSEMQYINTNHLVEIENDYFDIVRIAKNRSLSGVKIDVTCDHISYRLNKPEVEMKFENQTPQYIVEEILKGTDFKIGTIEFSEKINFIPKKQSRRSMLISLAKYLGGELLWNKFELSILKRRGHDKGLIFKVGENIREITVEIDATETPTLYAYEVDVLDLAHLPQYQFLSTCELGDTVGVEDTELGINTSLRIVSREYNPFKKVVPRLQIGNVIRDLTDYLTQDEEEEKEQFDLDVFKIGDIDCLKLDGIDVTEKERERLKNGTAYEPTATIEYEKLEQYLGLFVERASFDYGIRVREIVGEQVTDIYYKDIPRLREKYYPTDDGMIVQVILGHDIDNLTADSKFRAFAVKFVENIPEPTQDEYRIEIGTCPLANEMTYYFENSDGYDEVLSIVTGIVGDVVLSKPINLVAKAIETDGKFKSVQILATWGDGTMPDVKISIQAICLLKGTIGGESNV